MNLRDKAKNLLDNAEVVLANLEASEEEVAKAYSDIEQAEKLVERADKLESAKAISGDLSKANHPAPLPTQGAGNMPDVDEPEAKASKDDDIAKAVNVIRYGTGEDNSATSLIMREVYGGDYRQLNYEQSKAFDRYLRVGTDSPALRRQMWSVEDVRDMLAKGMGVADVKATMVEGTDVLGGFAVPVDVANSVIRRLRGLTSVRAAGATVIQTAGKSIEWLRVTGADNAEQYTGNVRGAWGSETQTPAEQNMTLGSLTIPVNIYTYKMPMSVSLLEDATNLTDLFAMEVAEALAIDEDNAFLTGDGANKPYGILPGGANDRSLTSVASGSSSTLTINGLKGLARGVASQYRGQNASLVGTSATGLVIEQLVDGDTRHYVESLVAGQYERMIAATWRENESVPAIAGSAFPLIYGDFSGYAIVERLGLSVQRYNDSNTGINKVEFHVRRRIGGSVIQPWKFALQTIST